MICPVCGHTPAPPATPEPTTTPDQGHPQDAAQEPPHRPVVALVRCVDGHGWHPTGRADECAVCSWKGVGVGDT